MKNNVAFNWEAYARAPVIGIIRGTAPDSILHIAENYLESGLYTLEVTLNTPGALLAIENLRREFPDLNVGAGTVCTPDGLQDALAAGAQFIVTPVLQETVVATAVREGVPVFPGTYTPTEIYKAWSLGAAAVKVFPATQLGPQYLRDVSAPLDDIKLLPTGGVSLENIKSFFEAGAFGVGMGSSLLRKDLIEAGEFGKLKEHFRAVRDAIAGYIPG